MWKILLILAIVAMVACCMGFRHYVWFMSIGYGFAVAAIGITLAIMGLTGTLTMTPANYLFCALFVAYGLRLGLFLAIREFKNATYKKTLTEAAGKEPPIFVKVFMWLYMGADYAAQTAGATFRFFNGAGDSALMWIGLVISAAAICTEAVADKQKSAQKKARPDMVATQGLYKIVRCPNYCSEILFWTGIVISSLDCLQGAAQWIIVLVGYVLIVYIMFDGAKRLEKRQFGRYGSNREYLDYASKTPIILPFLPIYHLYKDAK